MLSAAPSPGFPFGDGQDPRTPPAPLLPDYPLPGESTPGRRPSIAAVPIEPHPTTTSSASLNRAGFAGGCFVWVLRGQRRVLQSLVEGGFGLGRRDEADGLEQAAVVEPVDPREGGELDGFEGAPRPLPADHLGLEEADHGLGEGVVVAVADAADRRRDAGLGQALGVGDRDVLDAAITVVDEPAFDRPAGVQRLLEGVEDEAGRRPSATPASRRSAGRRHRPRRRRRRSPSRWRRR